MHDVFHFAPECLGAVLEVKAKMNTLTWKRKSKKVTRPSTSSSAFLRLDSS